MTPRIVYSPGYDIRFFGLEKLHPFDTRKYSRAWAELRKTFGPALEEHRLDPGAPVEEDDLLAVHTPEYLRKLKSSAYLAGALEPPFVALAPHSLLEKHVLRPMRLATRGTLVAAEAAMQCGMAVNLSGGYHHASADRGEGFCLYGDVALAVAQLCRAGRLTPGQDRVLYIDLDAHQGNGVERFFMEDRDVTIFDMYNADTYPQDQVAQERIDHNVRLKPGTGDEEYLGRLRESLPGALEPRPAIAFYNASTDLYEHDRIGGLRLTEGAVLERDRFVLQSLTGAGIPSVTVLSGGYSSHSYQLVANTVCDLLTRWS